MLLFEADAVWRSNPLSDPHVTEADADMVVFMNSVEKQPEYGQFLEEDSIGMGFTLLRATDRVRSLWHELMSAHRRELAYLDGVVGPLADGHGGEGIKNVSELVSVLSSQVAVGYSDEMALFQRLVKQARENKLVSISVLPWCLYPSGLWYDGGMGGDGYALRLACREAGQEPVVVQNNFIYGLGPKQSRARRWGHWFTQVGSTLDGETSLRGEGWGCENRERLQRDLGAMEESFQTLLPHERPSLDECPKCVLESNPNAKERVLGRRRGGI